MQYVSLSKIPNRYPTVSNYKKFKEGVVELNGLYPERNKINFQLPKYEDITPIDNTSFRFVISVLADEKDHIVPLEQPIKKILLQNSLHLKLFITI